MRAARRQRGRRSVEKCWHGDRFEPFIRGAAAGHLPAKGCTFPRLDQEGRDILRIEVRSDVTGAVLTGTYTRGESLVPAAEDADELGAYRFTRTAELERQVADQATEQEIAR